MKDDRDRPYSQEHYMRQNARIAANSRRWPRLGFVASLIGVVVVIALWRTGPFVSVAAGWSAAVAVTLARRKLERRRLNQ